MAEVTSRLRLAPRVVNCVTIRGLGSLVKYDGMGDHD